MTDAYFTGTVAGREFSASGRDGAVAPTRYAGRFDGGPPTAGKFAVGDFVIDVTTPAIWICETAGAPGAWLPSGWGLYDITPASTSTAIQYVTSGGSDSANGYSWSTGKATITAAIAALPANGGVVQLGYGTFTVASTARTDSVTFQNSNVVLDASIGSGDVGSYILGSWLNGPIQITAVTPGVSFTLALAVPHSTTSTNPIVKPGFVLPPGVEIRGVGGTLELGTGSIGVETLASTKILDSGTGITCLIPGPLDSTSNSSVRYGLTDLALWAGNANLYGLYLGNAAWYLTLTRCDVSFHGTAALVLDGNVNGFTAQSCLFTNNGTVGATGITGGVLHELYANAPGAQNVFINCFWIDNYGYSVNSGVNASGATALTFVGCGFNTVKTSAHSGSGSHCVVASNASGMTAFYNTYFEGAGSSSKFHLVTTGPVSAYSCGFHGAVGSQNVYQIQVSTSGLSLTGCWFDGASGSSIEISSGQTISWSGCVSSDPHFIFNQANSTNVAAAAAAGIGTVGPVFYPSNVSQTLTASTTVAPNSATIQVTAAGAITLINTPTLTAGADGQITTVVNVGTNAITFQSAGTLASSGLSLGATTRAVGAKGSLQLIYSAALSEWVETGFNAGGNG